MQPPSAPRMPCPAMCPAKAPAAPPLRQPMACADGAAKVRLRPAAAMRSRERIVTSLCHVLLKFHLFLVLLRHELQRLTVVLQGIVVGFDLRRAMRRRGLRLLRRPHD